MRDLLASLTGALDAGRDCVYCSVVDTRGSTPQKAGAAMLVFADGSQAGTLGGGCVEAEVKRHALRTLADDAPPQPQLSTFCLDDNYGWDDGLICGGRMSILAQPLKAASRAMSAANPAGPFAPYFHHFRRLVDSGAGCTEAVVVTAEQAGAPLGSRYLFDAAGQLVGSLGTLPLAALVAGLVPLTKRPRAWNAHGVAYLPVLPRITLLLVGGGHVAQAVARLAAEVDFEIWVLDDRAAYASAERFPIARRRLVGDIGTELQALRPDITPSVYCARRHARPCP